MSDPQKVSQVYDAMAPEYDAQVESIRLAACDELIYQTLIKYQGGRKVVDLGCGTGRAVASLGLRRAFRQYVGYDLSAGMLKVARAKFPKHEFVHQNMLDVEPVPDCLVISLYGSPCYISIKQMADLMKAWRDAGSSPYFLLYGLGRDKSTFEARQESGKLRPQYYGSEAIQQLRSYLPRLSFVGIDIYGQNQKHETAEEYLQALLEETRYHADIDECAWVFVALK